MLLLQRYRYTRSTWDTRGIFTEVLLFCAEFTCKWALCFLSYLLYVSEVIFKIFHCNIIILPAKMECRTINIVVPILTSLSEKNPSCINSLHLTYRVYKLAENINICILRQIQVVYTQTCVLITTLAFINLKVISLYWS